MNNIKEFNDHPMSRKEFWAVTAPATAAVLSYTALIACWKRPSMIAFRSNLRRPWAILFHERQILDV